MTEQLDLEDWLREHPANSDDTRKTAEMVVSKMENTTQTNNDDLDDYTKMYFTLKGDILALELLLKECREWIEFLGAKMKSEKNPKNAMYFEVLLMKIDNAIGEKK